VRSSHCASCAYVQPRADRARYAVQIVEEESDSNSLVGEQALDRLAKSIRTWRVMALALAGSLS
jgi:hypothetical protein